jgi:hypothetical protein
MSDFENKYRVWHKYMSYIKSSVRIAGCVAIMWVGNFSDLAFGLAFAFLIAELIGIAEEWV